MISSGRRRSEGSAGVVAVVSVTVPLVTVSAEEVLRNTLTPALLIRRSISR